MPSNVIREDVVRVGFEGDAFEELKKLKKQCDELRKKLGSIDDEPLEDLGDSAEKSNKHLKDVDITLTRIGKKSSNIAFNGLKKLASVSFKGMVVGLGAAAAGIGKIAFEATSAYAEFEQLEGGVKKLFGVGAANNVKEYANIVGKSVESVQDDYKKLVGAQDTVMKNSLGAYKTAGVSANKYMETVTGFSASLITSLKGDTQAAADWADTALTDMADNANTFGTGMEQIITTYQNLAKGQYMTLDNLKLGYGGTKEGAEQLTTAASKLDKTIKAGDISFANIVKAIHAVQKNMKISGISYKEYSALVESGTMSQQDAFDLLGTTAKEANFTVSGSLNQLKGAWENVLIAVGSGENLDTAFDNMLESFEIFMKNVGPVVERSLLGIGTVVDKMLPKLEEKFPEMMNNLLPPLIKAASAMLAGFIRALPNVIKTVVREIPNIAEDVAIALYGAFTGKTVPDDTFTGTTDGVKNLGNAIKWVIPIIGGLVVAFKGLKGIQAIKSVFGGLGKGGGKYPVRGNKGGIFSAFTSLANMPVKTVLKGIANLSLVIGAMGGLLWLGTIVFKSGVDFKEMAQVIVLIGLFGGIGIALAKFTGIVDSIPIMTTLKGIANISLVLGAMGALLWIAMKVFSNGIDFSEMLQVIGLIGIIGTVGTILTGFAALIGVIPIPAVLMGLANIGLVMGGLGALLFAATKAFSSGISFKEMFQVVALIGIIGTVGTLLSGIAAIIGLIPFPLVLSGLVNIGLVFAGLSKLIDPARRFFEAVATFPTVGFFMAEKMFECLAGLKNLPQNGGFIGFFTGNINYSKIAEGLESLSSDGAKRFFEMVGGLPAAAFTNTALLFNALSGIKEIPKSGGVEGFFGGDFNLGEIAEQLEMFANKAQIFFAQVNSLNLSNLNGMWDSLRAADTITTKVSEVVDDNIKDIVEKAQKLPKQMAGAIKSGASEFANAFVSIWQEAVKATARPVNKLLSGANFVLKEFGSAKRVASWTPYAGGTNGHKGGNALVNDGRGAELVQMPNGNTFIPHGRNVLMPNAPKGMKVLPAEQTARLMGKSNPTFRYAKGTGSFDVWEYVNNATGLVNAIKDNFVTYNDVSGIAVHFGKSMISTVTAEMFGWANKLFDEFGARSLSAYNPSSGVEQWRSTVIRALKMEGQYTPENVNRTLFQMQTESGGNPHAINLWDINAKNGVPSKGLMQVIDPTFRTYARPGFDTNIYDPLSNILASIRYAVSRYGTLAKAYRGVGYENGTGKVTSVNLPQYSPDTTPSVVNATNVRGGDTYAPVFNLTISGSEGDRSMYRKIKRMIDEAFEEKAERMNRRTRVLQEI